MSWREENIATMLSCATPEDVFRHLQCEARRLGMQSVSWVMKMPIPVLTPKVVIFNDYAKAWEQRYFSHNYLALDPTIKHGMASPLPMLWSDAAMQDAPEFWEEARAHGLGVGFVQSVFDGQGNGSMLTLSRDGTDFSETELEDKAAKFAWLAQLTHSVMSRLILPRELPESVANLTPREQEVLKLIAGGLTSLQIADQLKLSKRTADFHADEAIRKLGAHNRTDAAVKATLLGQTSCGHTLGAMGKIPAAQPERPGSEEERCDTAAILETPRPDLGEQRGTHRKPVNLTEFELQVLRWAEIGKSAAVTAQIMGISERSVRKARETAGKKLESHSILLSITHARRLGLL